MPFPATRRLLSLALAAGALLGNDRAQGALVIRFLNVGQGDAILITASDGQTILYDGGPSEARMRDYIRSLPIRRLDVVVASHADADHSTGLIPAVGLLKPRYFINNGLAGDTQTWARLVNVATQAGVPGLKAADQTLKMGDVTVQVIAPPPGMPGEQNLNSVGLLVQYGAFRALLTGDSEIQETEAWLRQQPDLFRNVDVYKAIHHGSLNGDHLRWLQAVQPRNVVVSVGPNSYGHPSLQAMTAYRLVNAQVWRTDQQGTITFTVQADGSYTIQPETGSAMRNRAVGQVATPARPTPASPAPATRPASPVAPAYYPTCAAARAAGVTPLLRGQPGYRPGLDRDGDGRACE